MALADFVVVKIVGRCNLDAAGAKIRIDIVVANNGNIPVRQRQANGLADQVAIARVLRVNRDSSIAEHGFRSSGRDNQMTRAIAERIAEVPHVAGFFTVLHFEIGNGGVKLRVPVNQSLTAIDQSFIKQADKGSLHCTRQAFVHGEAFPRPVQ